MLESDRLEIPVILSRALQEHQQGNLKAAADGYQDILRRDPRHCDALHLLGVLAQQLQNFDLSIELIRSAIAVNPSIAAFHNNLGNTFKKKKEYAEAASCYRQALLLNPQYFEAYMGLANVLSELNQISTALELYQAALKLQPQSADAHYNLARMLGKLERTSEAIAEYRSAIALDPRNSDAFYNLGSLLVKLKDYSGAIESYQSALALHPDDAECLNNLGLAYAGKDDLPSSFEFYQKALALRPDYVDALCNYSVALLKAGELHPAELLSRKAFELDRSSLQAANNLGTVLYQLGRAEDALACYRKALPMHPESADLHWNYSLALLLKGELPEGWQEYEWRSKVEPAASEARNWSISLWRGEALHGQTILLHAEQGLGDTLQFIRYLPMVVERGGRVVLQAPRVLHDLLLQMPGISRVIAPGDPAPEATCHCSLMSLPNAFQTSLETIPFPQGYLKVSDSAIASAREWWPVSGLRVGLVWAGNPKHPYSADRFFHVREMLPLLSIPGVSFCSLQVGAACEQLEDLPSDVQLEDLGLKYPSFTDTAAIIAGLDLVISVDTSIGHLAGALGVPVWILIPKYRIDWRWLREREDSVWYRSARLFRQSSPGDWPSTIQAIKEQLEILAANRR